MWTLGAIGFTAPAILAALVALPVLWWLLRAVPPAPVRRRFPGVALLLGLRDRDAESARTPWWLLLLRLTALAALILALAGPVLNPRPQGAGNGPLLVLLDGTWAEGRDWPRRIARAQAALDAAGAAGRPVAVMTWADPPPEGAQFRPAASWSERLAGLAPQPWAPASALPGWVADLPEGTETLWISDGIAHDGRAALQTALAGRGPVSVHQPETPLIALADATLSDALTVTARRGPATAGAEAALTLLAVGRDPAGTERDLGRAPLAFAPGALTAEARFDLPPELRNRIARFQIEGSRGAGAVHLADDSLRRRKVALLTVREGTEALALLSPLHYLRQALVPTADLIEAASIDELLLATPDVLVLADAPRLTEAESAALREWVEAGGLLLRFAGPRLAGTDPQATVAPDDPLLPVRLRTGGRTVGGAMSWGTPQRLAPFRDDSPFAGLAVPEEVEVRAQVLAQPGPDLAARSIAELADGTPLVTRRALGQGQVVLFHVAAGADWSSLPLSGLFVQMLERLAVSTPGAAASGGADVADRNWTLDARLDGFGLLSPAGDRGAVPGADLAGALGGARAPDAELPPGLYASGDARVALNATGPQTLLAPAVWPAGTRIETGTDATERNLAGLLFAAVVLGLALDALATLALGGRLVRAAAVVAGLALLAPGGADAQTRPQPAQTQAAATGDEARALEATAGVILGHVTSGDAQIDEVAQAGLRGLSDALFRRTSVEPGPPMLVDPETDDLALFPFLYWPVTEDSPLPSAAAYARLNRFLRSGGMILFDTRDAEVARLTGADTPAARRLRSIAAGLDVPELEPVPPDHVLTRTFYLLGDFPGRYAGSIVWVEAAPPDAERAEGMPFRNLNDGVTPVVLGGNDWASAWAIDAQGMPLLPIGRGTTGERQRELAIRFGINLIMHVLSGNYKSDQVHVPALLERLGQ